MQLQGETVQSDLHQSLALLGIATAGRYAAGDGRSKAQEHVAKQPAAEQLAAELKHPWSSVWLVHCHLSALSPACSSPPSLHVLPHNLCSEQIFIDSDRDERSQEEAVPWSTDRHRPSTTPPRKACNLVEKHLWSVVYCTDGLVAAFGRILFRCSGILLHGYLALSPVTQSWLLDISKGHICS